MGGEIISFFQNVKIPYGYGALTVQLIPSQSLIILPTIVFVSSYTVFKLCPLPMAITPECATKIRPNLL